MSGLDLHITIPEGPGRRRALEEGLREAIRSGRLAAGQRLPSSRSLAGDLGMARGTVVEAYEQLVVEGFLTSRQGAGTAVAAGAAPPVRPLAKLTRAAPVADFRFGRPDTSAFPRREWMAALQRAVVTLSDRALGPGAPGGSHELRAELAAYLRRARGVVAEPDRLIVCAGFLQGLRLVCDTLARQGVGAIALEDPCLPDHRRVVEAAGLESLALPVDQYGAQPDRDVLARVGAVLLTPAHQAPLGSTLSPERRATFAAWAADTGRYVIEDDYDSEFRYDRHPVGALQSLAPHQVLHIGSVSKTLAPAVRLGWMVVPSAIVDPVLDAKRRTDRGTSLFDQLALAEMIRTGQFDRHIRRMRGRYHRRREQLLGLLTETAPWLEVIGADAGLHVLARLPADGPSEDDLIRTAAAQSVSLTALRPFWHGQGPRSAAVIIGYGAPADHAYDRALMLLGGALRVAAG